MVRLPSPARAGLLVVIILFPLTIVSPARAEKASGLTWVRDYGVGNAFSVQETRDGGFVLVGGLIVPWVLKTGSSGEPQWERNYTPTGFGEASAGFVQQTSDGGYLLTGSVTPTGNGFSDAWLLKLDYKGNVAWSKTYGRGNEAFSMAEQTNDGGYVAAGNTGTIGPHDSNGWVLKLDRDGNILWEEAFEGEDIHSIDQASDGGFVVAGTVGVSKGAYAWVFKLDPTGMMVWQRAFGVTTYNPAYSVQKTHDGGYIVVGEAITLAPYGSFLFSKTLILRLDKNGEMTWQKSYDRGGFTTPNSIQEMSDRGFIVAGVSRPTSSGTGLSGSWLVKLDSEGNLVWQKNYPYIQYARATRGGGIIAAGSSVLKLDNEGSVEGCALGTPSNATIASTAVTAISSVVTSVRTDTPTARTEVTVTTNSVNVQTQCIASQDPHDRSHTSKPITMFEHKLKPQRNSRLVLR